MQQVASESGRWDGINAVMRPTSPQTRVFVDVSSSQETNLVRAMRLH